MTLRSKTRSYRYGFKSSSTQKLRAFAARRPEVLLPLLHKRRSNIRVSQMLRVGKKHRKKCGITYFGLLGHEVALLKSMMECAPDLAADYELREPNEVGSCGIVVVNRDSQLATSWWKFYKKRHPSAVPLFVTDSKQHPDDSVLCKRPFSPSFLHAAFQGLVSENMP